MSSRARNVSRTEASRQGRRSDPYDRNSRPQAAAAGSAGRVVESYPPQSINIKGAGGDFVVIVGNVAKGTSIEDIKLTFDPYGEVVDVIQRPPPNLNYPSVSFEVFFTRKEDGLAACQSLNGCLADGRVLSVAPPVTDAYSASRPALTSFTGQVSAAARQRVANTGRIEPGPAPYPREVEPHAATRELMGVGVQKNFIPNAGVVAPVEPTAPVSNRRKAPTAPAAQQQKKKAPTGPAPKSLQHRLGMGPTAAEKKRAEAVKLAQRKIKQTSGKALPSAAQVPGSTASLAARIAGANKGAKGAKKDTSVKSLKDRLTVPLAERLAAASTSASDPAKAEAKKRKRATAKAKAAGKKAGGMDID